MSDIGYEPTPESGVAKLRARVAELEHDISRHLAVISEIESERGDLRQARDAAWDRIEELEAENARLTALVFDAGACVRAAIRAEDFVAEGACDPEKILRRIDNERKPSPAKRRQAMAEITAEAQRMGLYD